MTQKQVDIQKLLELEQQEHYQNFQVEESKTAAVNIQDPLAETMKSLKRELNLDIFSSDNAIEKKITKKQRSRSPSIKKYSSTKVKARNFLTNVSYNRANNNHYQNRSFVIDCFSFLLLYLNPFYLERKFESIVERDFVNVLWCYMMPETLYNFICKDDNFKILNKVKLKFQHANEIVRLFIEDESFSPQQQQFNILKDYLIKHGKSYQFIFGNLFPRYFARIDDYGIQSKTRFNIHYKNYLSQKSVFDWCQKNSFLPAVGDLLDENKGNNNNNKSCISTDSTPLNMTKLNDEEIDFKKEEKEVVDYITTTVVVVEDENKKVAREKVLEKINEEEKKEKKKMKLKVSAEKKRQKRNEKKRKLEEKLTENTKKYKRLKKVK